MPLSGCSQDEAINFLSMVYSATPNKHLRASPFATLKLADKCGMQVSLCLTPKLNTCPSV